MAHITSTASSEFKTELEVSGVTQSQLKFKLIKPCVTYHVIGVNRHMEFSTLKMKEVLKSQTTKRVSKDAASALSERLENYGEEVAKKAIKLAEEDGRVTVRKEDIRAALQE